MQGMSMSLLKTRRRLVVRVGDATWFAARLEKLAAYCVGHSALRSRSAQTAPLLDDVDDAWTTPSYRSVDAVEERGGRPGALDGVCSHCRNHCTACVYDCQIRFDTPEEGFVVSDLQEAVHRGVLDGDDLEFFNMSIEEWDQHRPLHQGMSVTCEVERKRINSSRRRAGLRAGRRKARVVLGGDHDTDPKWPAVLLTFDRGVSNSFKAKAKTETWC